jgi:hypothetical protein
MNQFIDIEWNIETHERDNYYVSIDCLEKEKQDGIVKRDCCLKSHEGCNIATCGCKPEDGWKIRLYDKHTNLIDEKEYNKPFSTIIISKNTYGIPNISVK